MDATQSSQDDRRQQLRDAAASMALALEQIFQLMVLEVRWKDIPLCKGPVERALEQFVIHRSVVFSLARACLSDRWRDEFHANCLEVENGVKRWLIAAEDVINNLRIFAEVYPDEFSRKQNESNVEPKQIPLDEDTWKQTREWARSIADECIALAGDSKLLTPKPNWNSDSNELRFNGKTVRTYARNASKCRPVLDAFQQQGWPEVIVDPLGTKDGQRVNQTVKQLNTDLQGISFSAGGDGNSFRWKRGRKRKKRKK